MTRTSSLCVCCLVTFWPGWHLWRIRSGWSSKSSLLGSSSNPDVQWLLLSLEWNHASMSVMASWSRCGPTTNLSPLGRSHQPTTRVRSNGCMPACASSMSRRRTSRIASTRAQRLVASRDDTPALADADRELLGDTLRSLRRGIGERGGEQLLHGEPHPGNVLATTNGLLFIDLETCCRGPVEFDLAHAPEEVSEHYPGLDLGLLRECRILVLAMITTWRWDRGDQLPNGRQLGTEWLSQIRAALERNGLDTHR
jgi:Phosphotransferase enzyme family